MASNVLPELSLPSFNCPICHALASQSWFKLAGEVVSENKRSGLRSGYAVQNASAEVDEDEEETKKRLWDAGERLLKHPATWVYRQYLNYEQEILNLHLSRCFACKGLSIWLKRELIWPTSKLEIEPHADMPRY